MDNHDHWVVLHKEGPEFESQVFGPFSLESARNFVSKNTLKRHALPVLTPSVRDWAQR